MSCKPYDEFIMKYIDGELNDIEQAKLIQHVSECEACRSEFEDLKNVLGALEKSKELEPPADLQTSIMAKVCAIDIYNKKSREKKLMMLYFISTITLTILILSLALIFKNNILDLMLYMEVPVEAAYWTYGVLTRISAEAAMIYGYVLYFKNLLAD
ncbi:MAG: hypothetical protein GX660_05250, partial [Clostridiaceae bacterium]|nr:hypothetical protein [Clostridiaceae bacterium]